MQRFLKYWLPILLWLGMIFVGSTDLMSAEHTSRFIGPFLQWLKPDISPAMLASIHFFVRKSAHLGEYAVLALLMFRAVTSMTHLKWPVLILSVGIWIACLFVAATDEFHQTLVQSRGASVADVMIDSGGAVLGLFIGARLRMCRLAKLKSTSARL
jgi:VanZ family protein